MSLFRGQGTTIAAVQLQIEPSRPEENLPRAAELVASAAGSGAALACLPAAFATGLNLPTLRSDATPLDGPVVAFLAEQARRHQIHLAAGVLLSEGRELYDAAVLVGPSGDLLGVYRRASVWSGERDYIAAGQPLDAIETPVGRIGLQVSHDLRFPEASRHLLGQEVDIIVCVANLFVDYSQAALSVCRARAADNECALVLASSSGESRFAGMDYLGRSAIVDGLLVGASHGDEDDILALAPPRARDTVLTAQLYLRARRKTRATLPFHADADATWSTRFVGAGR